MTNILNSVEEHPVYLFDHLIRLGPESSYDYQPAKARSVAIDRFTNQIFVIVVDDYDGSSGILIYSESGEFLRSFYDDNITFASNSSMAIHKENMYINKRHFCFQHFNIADSISLIDQMYDTSESFVTSFVDREYLESLEFDISNEGDLFVPDYSNYHIKILDGNLIYKRHISHYSMLKPCGVKLISDEVYVLGDCPKQSYYCFHIFTHMGEKLRSTFFNGIPNGVRCRGFCVDNHGNIAVTDHNTQQIKFFTKEGNIFETMNTLSGSSDKSVYPFGIAWIGKKKLVVVSRNMFEIYSRF